MKKQNEMVEKWRYEWMAERKDKHSEDTHRLANEVIALNDKLKEIEALCSEVVAIIENVK